MLKILLKAAVLFLIVLSIYLIINPMACSNMLAGRERTDWSEIGNKGATHPMGERRDQIKAEPAEQDELLAPEQDEWGEGIFDTNTMKEEPAQPTYSQHDIDRAIATRYVELEREYAADTSKSDKDRSRELAFQVMDDFEMTPEEWENFLARATASDLFNQIRQELSSTPTPTAPAAAK